MPEISTSFTEAAENVRKLTKKPQPEELLKLYSLYKQATEGDCAEDRPTGLLDIKGKAKWDNWSKLKGMTSEEAQSKYIAHVKDLQTKYAQ